MSVNKPKVVFDTQILVRAAINRRSLAAKLFFEWRESYELVSSPATFAEAQDVLNRPSLRAKFLALTDGVVEEILTLLRQSSRVISTDVPAMSRDPKDDIFLACAVANEAKVIVSEDNDLLVLNPYQGIQIINAQDFLRMLQSLSSASPDADNDSN